MWKRLHYQSIEHEVDCRKMIKVVRNSAIIFFVIITIKFHKCFIIRSRAPLILQREKAYISSRNDASKFRRGRTSSNSEDFPHRWELIWIFITIDDDPRSMKTSRELFLIPSRENCCEKLFRAHSQDAFDVECGEHWVGLTNSPREMWNFLITSRARRRKCFS